MQGITGKSLKYFFELQKEFLQKKSDAFYYPHQKLTTIKFSSPTLFQNTLTEYRQLLPLVLIAIVKFKGSRYLYVEQINIQQIMMKK